MVTMNCVILWLGVLIYKTNVCNTIDWGSIVCHGEKNDDSTDDGSVPLARFPWLGVVQHGFYLGGKIHFAVTAGVLIHYGYVLASAEDVGRIPIDQMRNSTKFIVWGSGGEKYSLWIYDYMLHPDYVSKKTFATVALLQLRDWGSKKIGAPVMPVCLPLRGMGSFDNLHVIKLSDDRKEIEKEIYKVNYVTDRDCAEFYYRSQLTYQKMKPAHSLCASVEAETKSCVWDAGALLVTRINNVYWTLLGFGVRGPGCGAPARFVSMQHTLQWINEAITNVPLEDVPEDSTALFLRQLSPYEMVMYKADTVIPTEYGQCERGERGNVIYKDQSELLMTQNIGQGFYFVAVYDIAMFSCAVVRFETMSRTMTSFWVEHHCIREGTAHAPHMIGVDFKKLECFAYFKTSAFIEFRFVYSFKALIELTIYGVKLPPLILNPWESTVTTDAWYPTATNLARGTFYPYYLGYWYV